MTIKEVYLKTKIILINYFLDEVVNEVAATFNVAHPKIAFSTKKSVKLLRLPVKEVDLLANPHEFLKGT